MRTKLAAVLLAAATALLVSAPAVADDVFQVKPASVVNLACNAGGTTVTVSALAEGYARFIVTTENISFCFAATCVPPAGMTLVPGTNEPIPVSPSSVVSCSSPSGAGKLQLVPAELVR